MKDGDAELFSTSFANTKLNLNNINIIKEAVLGVAQGNRSTLSDEKLAEINLKLLPKMKSHKQL